MDGRTYTRRTKMEIKGARAAEENKRAEERRAHLLLENTWRMRETENEKENGFCHNCTLSNIMK